ncbi:MAG: arginine--tRNA ligase [Spirochaetes bacterium]|nr:MAG: arginine--tRNA ligase [Spirochaetota bacterium]
MNTKDMIEGIVREALACAEKDGAISSGDTPPIKIEYPKEEKFGDYATPFAMEAARVFRRSPFEIGSVIARYMQGSDMLERVDVVKPGFINIFLSSAYLYGVLKTVLSARDDYGRNRKEKPRRVNIEFVSANPTGPLNIVSARAAAIGDTLANLLEAAGDNVEKEFYVNDFGNQVDLLGLSVLCRYRELAGETVNFPEDGYHGAYVKDIAAYIKDNLAQDVDRLSGEAQKIDFMARKAIELNVSGQKRDLARFNVNFDAWFSERSLHEAGEVPRTKEEMEARGLLYTEEGKCVFRSTDFGDDKDRVVVRDDGRPTYLLADITYHRDKIRRGYDLIIDIWGPDHHGYIARMAGAMKAFGYGEGSFKVLIAQQVNLVMEGELVKMSKRLGKFSTMSELLDEIGVDVARYFFVMRSTDSHLDFDLALAKKQSSENPVFYLQYAHARICSIFREAEKRGLGYAPESMEGDQLKNPEAVALLKLLARFPEEIADAANTCEPHRITNHLLRLAQGYHRFYTEHRVLADDPVQRNSFLALCDGVRIVLKNGLHLLGVTAPERM